MSQASPKSKTRFTLLHSSRRPTELPPAELLRPLLAYSQAHPDKLNLRLFVDSSEGPSHPAAPSSTLAVGRIGRAAIEDAMGAGSKSWWRSLFGASSSSRSLGNEAGKKVMFLVCGPDPYVKHPFRRRDVEGSRCSFSCLFQNGGGHRWAFRPKLLTGRRWWGAGGAGVRQGVRLEAVDSHWGPLFERFADMMLGTALRPVRRSRTQGQTICRLICEDEK